MIIFICGDGLSVSSPLGGEEGAQHASVGKVRGSRSRNCITCSPSSSQASLGPRLLPAGEKENNRVLKVPDHEGIGFAIGYALLRQIPAALHIELFRIARIKMKLGHAMLTGLILNGRHELSCHAALSIFGSHIQTRQPG